MKRRIIALLLAGALSLSGVSGLNVHAMEDDETEIIADSTQESEKAEVESIEYSETEQIRESAVETEVEEQMKSWNSGKHLRERLLMLAACILIRRMYYRVTRFILGLG